MEYLIAIVGVLGLFFLILLYRITVYGFVISKFYIWFILPNFPNLPHITMIQWWGILLFLFALTDKTKTSYKEEKEVNWTSSVIGALLSPWLVLVLGYLSYLSFLGG